MRRAPRRIPVATAPRVLAAIAALAAFAAPAVDAADPPGAAPGVRYVYLIRHGMYDYVDSLDPRMASGLNALGHEQARLLAARLKGLPVRVSRIVSSDFARARETADDIGGVLGMAAERDTLIQECYPPTDSVERDREHPPAEMALCQAKLEAAWGKYFRPSPAADAHDLLVCHGNVIRWLVSRALGCDIRRWLTMDIANASLTVVSVRADGTTRLVMYSDVGHLPVAKQTWAGRGAGWGTPVPR